MLPEHGCTTACQSSEYECAVDTRHALATILNNSAVYSRNSNRPRTEPCGTPKASYMITDRPPA